MNDLFLKNGYFMINDIYAERQSNYNEALFEMSHPRPTNAILLFSGASAIYTSSDGDSLYVPHGAMVFIPKGSTYKIKCFSVTNDTKPESLLFEFNLVKMNIARGEKNELSSFPDNSVDIFPDDKKITIIDYRANLCKQLFTALIECFNNKDSSPLSVYCRAYAIFEYISKISHNKHEYINNSIPDEVLKLLSNFENNELSVSEIASICAMSTSNLNKKFKRILNMTPIEYRLESKITEIKNMLINSDMSIEEMANKLNFCDGAYLCRIFKKKTGMTPKEFKITKK